MKIINLDELELKCLNFGIKNNFFTEEQLQDKNLVTINITGKYHSKCCEIYFTFPNVPLDSAEHLNINKPIRFIAESWENLYYQIDKFFSNTWDYLEDNSKMPLCMKIAEMISKQSKNGFVCAGKINEEIRKLL